MVCNGIHLETVGIPVMVSIFVCLFVFSRVLLIFVVVVVCHFISICTAIIYLIIELVIFYSTLGRFFLSVYRRSNLATLKHPPHPSLSVARRARCVTMATPKPAYYPTK